MNCVGCNEKISSGSELYIDRIVDGTCVVRFYTHLACAKSGVSQARADDKLTTMGVRRG